MKKIHQPSWIGDEVEIGEGTRIQAFAFIPNGVTIGKDVFIGPHVCFTNDPNLICKGKDYWKKTLVEKGAKIGANSSILAGITIGENATIGMGSVVLKDVPANEVWGGNPAKFLKRKGKWAIIGLGFISGRHIKSIYEIGDELILTCDNDPSKGATFLDWREMMKDERWKEITHIAVCAPNYLHFEMCKAMEDKIVLCEKPLALSSGDVKKLNAFTVLQLRHHPDVKWLKFRAPSLNIRSGELVVKVKRDPSYWSGWKGDEEKSGGILFNLGIHYFDLLIYLFGEDYQIIRSVYSPKKAQGAIMFGKTLIEYHLEIMDNDKDQDRKLVFDGLNISLSKQDNLSFEDLHRLVYEDLKRGKGVTVKDALPSIELVEKLVL